MERKRNVQAVERYGGRVTKPEFIRRCDFIKSRIEKKLLREEVAFLMGRNLYLLRGVEEMAWGIRFNADDIKVLSEILGKNQQHLLETDPAETSSSVIDGLSMVKNGKLCYELESGWKDIDNGKTVFKDRTPCKILQKEVEILEWTLSKTEKLIAGGYFDEPQSGLQLFNTLQKCIGEQLRPLVVKKAVRFHLLDRKLVCFRNKEGMFRYNRSLNKRSVYYI